MGKSELVALHCLSSLCLVIVIFLLIFLMVLRISLQCVIVVFVHHTRLLFVVQLGQSLLSYLPISFERSFIGIYNEIFHKWPLKNKQKKGIKDRSQLGS